MGIKMIACCASPLHWPQEFPEPLQLLCPDLEGRTHQFVRDNDLHAKKYLCNGCISHKSPPKKFIQFSFDCFPHLKVSKKSEATFSLLFLEYWQRSLLLPYRSVTPSWLCFITQPRPLFAWCVVSFHWQAWNIVSGRGKWDKKTAKGINPWVK